MVRLWTLLTHVYRHVRGLPHPETVAIAQRTDALKRQYDQFLAVAREHEVAREKVLLSNVRDVVAAVQAVDHALKQRQDAVKKALDAALCEVEGELQGRVDARNSDVDAQLKAATDRLQLLKADVLGSGRDKATSVAGADEEFARVMRGVDQVLSESNKGSVPEKGEVLLRRTAEKPQPT
eukprot:jgi/Chlat1/6793/Chrsp51S06492